MAKLAFPPIHSTLVQIAYKNSSPSIMPSNKTEQVVFFAFYMTWSAIIF